MIWPFDTIDEETYRAFQAYHRANPWVYPAFKRIAFKIKERRKRYGAKAIIEILRYENMIDTPSRPFKINNDFTSLYARLLIYNHPEFKNFFSLRTITGIKRTRGNSYWRKAA